MAPEFNFFVSTEDNALVENVKARASANRQALGNRQELKKAENVVRNQATKNDNPTRSGAIRPRKAPAEEELTAHRRGGLKVLNLVMGNGPAHVNHESRLFWEVLNDGFNTKFYNPGPVDNITYEKIRSDYADAMDVSIAELNNVYGTKATNVYLHIIGSQFVSPSIITFPWPDNPDFLAYGIDQGSMTITDALPEAIGNRSNVRKITMRADVADVVGHLRSNGVDITAYDCIFIQTAYLRPTPGVNGVSISINNPPLVDYYTVRPPQVGYNYRYLSLLSPVIFDSNEEPVEGSAPLLNLLTQLDGPNTYAFRDQIFPSYMPNSVVREYTTENVEDTMRQIQKSSKRLIDIRYSGSTGAFVSTDEYTLLTGYAYFSVDRATTPVGGGGLNDNYTWNEKLPLNTVYKRTIPFFGTLQSRLRYPLKSTDVIAPAQTYERGNSTAPNLPFPEFVPIPVQTTERSEELHEVLRFAYAVYLANAVAQNYTGANTFLQATTHTLAVEAELDSTYIAYDFDAAYWYPYLVFEVSSAARALYSVAITQKNLKRA